jgi:glutamate racemase
MGCFFIVLSFRMTTTENLPGILPEVIAKLNEQMPPLPLPEVFAKKPKMMRELVEEMKLEDFDDLRKLYTLAYKLGITHSWTILDRIIDEALPDIEVFDQGTQTVDNPEEEINDEEELGVEEDSSIEMEEEENVDTDIEIEENPTPSQEQEETTPNEENPQE